MTEAYIIADNIVSPIGFSSEENFSQLKNSVSGIKQHDDKTISETAFYASLFDKNDDRVNADQFFSRFEKLLIASIGDALAQTSIETKSKRSLLIVSTTKGNISLLETEAYNDQLADRISLSRSANKVAGHFQFTNKPVVVSNACISGSLAIITASRMIQAGQYDHIVVTGADVVSKFVLSGFQSFQAISDGVCKPFDASRNGINLGEGAGTLILSSDKNNSRGIKVVGGSVSNDANHISGPSRTGEELNLAIKRAIKDAALDVSDIDFISAHGTATVYNDEMESKAISLADMKHIPVNSLKGYYGHTLGAAGLIESIITMHSMKKDLIIPTLGFNQLGVSMPINVVSSLQKTEMQHTLKMASGFGSCNAAVVFSKH